MVQLVGEVLLQKQRCSNCVNKAALRGLKIQTLLKIIAGLPELANGTKIFVYKYSMQIHIYVN